ncbi:hypothetical protein Tco_0493251 [Tanacetum coccineum]
MVNRYEDKLPNRYLEMKWAEVCFLNRYENSSLKTCKSLWYQTATNAKPLLEYSWILDIITQSNEPTSPQPLNPLIDNISDVPPRPSNPQLLQSHPSLDITLSLSPTTLLDHILGTPSPPSSPQPQPPIMGHLLYYNYHDYHGSTCIC